MEPNLGAIGLATRREMERVAPQLASISQWPIMRHKRYSNAARPSLGVLPRCRNTEHHVMR
eukprot:2838651-Prymnesium_polylepis.2